MKKTWTYRVMVQVLLIVTAIPMSLKTIDITIFEYLLLWVIALGFMAISVAIEEIIE